MSALLEQLGEPAPSWRISVSTTSSGGILAIARGDEESSSSSYSCLVPASSSKPLFGQGDGAFGVLLERLYECRTQLTLRGFEYTLPSGASLSLFQTFLRPWVRQSVALDEEEEWSVGSKTELKAGMEEPRDLFIVAAEADRLLVEDLRLQLEAADLVFEEPKVGSGKRGASDTAGHKLAAIAVQI